MAPLKKDIPVVETDLDENIPDEPQVKTKKDDLVVIKIDPKMTDGGIRVNGKLYVGTLKVTQEQADDLYRIQEEYYETVQKLTNKNVSVRMKNDFQKEALFLAHGQDFEGKKGYSKDYGLLPHHEWLHCSKSFQDELLAKRKALYGY